MLIYNHKKEFLGIDETDLRSLGFSSLSELQTQTDDFADLFVKEPGYIHNFKHIHWIDFAQYNDSIEGARVIIQTSSKKFKCNIEIKTAYLIDNSEEKAFLVYLQNLRELSVDENDEVTETLIETSTPKIIEDTPKPAAIAEVVYEQEPIEEQASESDFEQEPIEEQASESDFEQETTIQTEISEPDEIENKTEEEIYEESPLELSLNEPMNIVLDEEENQLEETSDENEFEEIQNGYIYDPHVASAELGLPVDLIEEFIQDFIDQAKEFKDKLYSSFESGDTSTVKSLSHKLKGVAANLRIEDALDALTIINTSNNQTEVKSNLDTFYIIISKLAGEKVAAVKKAKKHVTPIIEKEELTNDIEHEASDIDDPLTIDFKDDSETTPEKIKTEKVEESEDDLVLSFKDDEESYIEIDAKKEIEDEKNTEDDLVVDFKDDNDYDRPKEEIKTDSDDEDEDDFIIDFKYENNTDEVNNQDSNEIKDKIEVEESAITYNKESAAKEIGLDHESFEELFNDYIDEAKTLSFKINNAIESGDDSLWKSNAIQLKGMSDNIRINDFKSELETLINTKDVQAAKAAGEKINILISKISNIES